MTGAAVALALSGLLTACTGSSDTGEDDGTKHGGTASSAPAAEPGKYDTLPEPCGSVSTDTLKNLLPGAEAAQNGEGDANPSASPFEGEADVTYDTDRRVGCRWKSSTTLGTRHLSIDMERVVSYDPDISDDEQAQLLYGEQAEKAGIAVPGASADTADDETGAGDATGADDGSNEGGGDGGGEKPDMGSAARPAASGSDSRSGSRSDSDSGSADAGAAGKGEGSSDGDGKGTGGSPGASASSGPGKGSDPTVSPSPSDDLSPRALDGIGDDAFMDDQLDTGDSGVHRDVTLVFRTANVLVTVAYDQWVTDTRRLPDSTDLQEKATSVAGELAEHFADN